MLVQESLRLSAICCTLDCTSVSFIATVLCRAKKAGMGAHHPCMLSTFQLIPCYSHGVHSGRCFDYVDIFLGPMLLLLFTSISGAVHAARAFMHDRQQHISAADIIFKCHFKLSPEPSKQFKRQQKAQRTQTQVTGHKKRKYRQHYGPRQMNC